jgi:opacity protein-like surface antigen
VLQNPIDEVGISNAAKFQRIQNALGFSVLWDLNDVKVTFGYDHFNFWAVDSEFSYLDRSEEQAFASVAFSLSETLVVGLDAGGSYFKYDEDFQNDGWSANVGVFAEMQVSNYLSVRAAAGPQVMQFGSGGGNLDNDDVGSGYGELSVSHKINRRMTQTFAIGYENRLGLNANAVADFYLRYQADWRVNSKLNVSLEGLYEDADETDTQLGSEHSRRFAAGLGVSYKLGRKISVSANYRYAVKDSNLQYRDYQQNVVSVGIRYDF